MSNYYINEIDREKLNNELLKHNGIIRPSDLNFKCLKPKVLPINKNYKIKWKLSGDFRKIYPTTNAYNRAILIPCGKCENCRKKQSFNWAKRIEWEAWYQSYTNKRENIFLTLTYDEKNKISRLFEINSFYKKIVKQHMDDFIKKIKNKTRIWQNGKRVYDKNISYFWVSELGSKTMRRHQHMIVCGLPKKLLENHIMIGQSKSREPLFTNQFLIENWNRGIINYGAVNTASAMYVSQYVFDKNSYDYVYKCCSQNIGKNEYYHLMKTQPNDSRTDEPNPLILRLKRKAMKNDWKYLRLLNWIEKNTIAHNYDNSINKEAKILKTIKCGSLPWENEILYDKYNKLNIDNQYWNNMIRHQAKKQTEWMFRSTRDFDDSELCSNEFYLMKLKQRKRF